jgi:hypothetical protein
LLGIQVGKNAITHHNSDEAVLEHTARPVLNPEFFTMCAFSVLIPGRVQLTPHPEMWFGAMDLYRDRFHGFTSAGGLGGHPWHIRLQRVVFVLLTTYSLLLDMALTRLASFELSRVVPRVRIKSSSGAYCGLASQ